MKQIFSIWYMAILLFAGCAGGQDGNEKSSQILSGITSSSLLEIVTNPQKTFSQSVATGTHYVDALAGNNSNPGTSLAPYRTITYAVSQPGTTIYVAPGTYNEALGEIFPIKIPAGVSLIGNELGKGTDSKDGNSGYTGAGVTPNKGPTLIYGVGPISPGVSNFDTLVLANNSTVAGFTITNPRPLDITTTTTAVYIQGASTGLTTGITVRNNTLTGTPGGTGIFIVPSNQSGSGNIISGNSIFLNYIGLYNGTTNTISKVEYNSITRNNFGVMITANSNFNNNMDLGGGSTGSKGHNILSCNTRYDISMPGLNMINLYAKNNQWDHIPPSVVTDGFGDIWDQMNSTIFTTGMSLAPANCNP
ncbi:PF07602 family protein [Leptospira weilii serovar Topaz str. LT2116]|uniref:PF07602 family protein n=1 Tax=Leptospira weilii serovar Topaz str. LT2116 TaxID=1088540 RepID=M3GW58_9LEPT|nr:PF07602 family protein [Leptospira weilii serovar Topaz str. LT2116]